MYIKVSINNEVIKYPYSLAELETDFPNTSFPSEITEESLKEFGVYKIVPSEPPFVNYDEDLIEETPEFIDNKWVQKWKIIKASEEDMIFREAFKARTVREERNIRLKDTDWVMLEDSTINPEDKEKYRVYRQKLREITNQPSFPWEVIWPSL